jgi:hypothetical protein
VTGALRVIVTTRPLALGSAAVVVNCRDLVVSRGGEALRFQKRSHGNICFHLLAALLAAHASQRAVGGAEMIAAIYGHRPDGGPDFAAANIRQHYSRLRWRLPEIGLGLEMWRLGLAPRIVDAWALMAAETVAA